MASVQGNNKLRVLMATPRYFPLMGGVETHVYETARRLADAGADVTVLTTRASGELPEHERQEGVAIRRMQTYPAQRDYYFAPRLVSEVVRGGWDVVHCQGVHTLVPPMAMAAARRAGVPYVLTFHTGGHSSRLRSAVRGAQWRAMRPLLKDAARLVGVSRFEADYFRTTLGLPNSQFAVIPNGGRLPEAPEDVEATRQKLIVSVGRLERYKGHQRVIRALPTVRETYPDARLLILGAGPYEGELRHIAAESGVEGAVEIKAVPSGERGAMSALLSSAAVVTLLSEYEAHPIAVMEALALRRPTLVAYTSGLMEFADRGLARAVRIDGKPADVAQAILSQIDDPLVPQSVSLPTWEACAESLMDLYRTVARRPVCVS